VLTTSRLTRLRETGRVRISDAVFPKALGAGTRQMNRRIRHDEMCNKNEFEDGLGDWRLN
jgi:hypothetical protein